MAKFKPPEISWTAQDLHQEWRRFSRQAQRRPVAQERRERARELPEAVGRR